jgi:hypothetical protein
MPPGNISCAPARPRYSRCTEARFQKRETKHGQRQPHRARTRLVLAAQWSEEDPGKSPASLVLTEQCRSSCPIANRSIHWRKQTCGSTVIPCCAHRQRTASALCTAVGKKIRAPSRPIRHEFCEEIGTKFTSSRFL